MRGTGPYYYGWNVIGVAMVFQAISFGLTGYTFGHWVVPWSEEFGVSRGQIMIGVTLMNAVMGMISPFAGMAMDRMSIRGLVASGGVILSLGFVAAAQANGLWSIIFVYASLVPLGLILAGPLPASTLAARWFDKSRGLAIGLSSIGTSIGGALLPPLAAYLLTRYGWRDAHLYLAALIVVGIVPIVWLVVGNDPESKGIAPEGSGRADGATVAPPAHHKDWTMREIMHQSNFWVTALAFGLLITAFGAIQPNLVPYAQDLGIGVEDAALLMTVLAMAGVGGKIMFGTAADRVDARYLFWITVSILSLAMVLMMGTPDYFMLVSVSALMGLASGGFLPLMGAIIGSRFGPVAFGRVMGLLGPFTMPVAIIGPPLAGYIRDITGSYDLALQIFLVFMVCAAGVMWFLRPAPVED